jgi:hypothetical protein
MAEPTNQIYVDRWTTATAELPFGPDAKEFFTHAVNETDIFAMTTAKQEKGGPFGAALWVVSAFPAEKGGRRLLRFTFVGPKIASNAVISTGIASNHAESEDLSAVRRNTTVRYLKRLQASGETALTAVVQVSSGESCCTCRAKQCLFAENLYALGLLPRGNFFVAFKAAYERTALDAGFHDKPYDMAFRVMLRTGVLHAPTFLASLESNTQCVSDMNQAEAPSIPVRQAAASDVPPEVRELFTKESQGRTRPVAVVANTAGDNGQFRVLSVQADKRDNRGKKSSRRSRGSTYSTDESGVNDFERSAITAALHRACQRQRSEGVFESWDLDNATVYTNLDSIGPLAYSEAQWCNVKQFVSLATDFGSEAVEKAGRECPQLDNRELFIRVASEYNSSQSSIRVTHLGQTRTVSPASDAVRSQEPSIAHVYWKALSASEALRGKFQDYMHRGEAANKFQVAVFPIAGPWSQTPHRDMQYNGAEKSKL